ncbi:MAG: CBS domain-containing protein [Acidobacteriota bacterium]|nr:CBS domain-containing protein [Acidobacteriota bacterium]
MKTAEDIILDKNNEIISVTRTQTVAEAIDLMNKNKIGAILIEENNDLIGIWTERDYLRGSSDPAFDPKNAKVGDHMTSPLHFAQHDATLTQLEEMFLGLYLRHIPVKKNNRVVGMVSIGDVLRANLLAKDRQIKELNSMASWQYYENWGWDRQK